jgi:hypothetical protein
VQNLQAHIPHSDIVWYARKEGKKMVKFISNKYFGLNGAILDDIVCIIEEICNIEYKFLFCNFLQMAALFFLMTVGLPIMGVLTIQGCLYVLCVYGHIALVGLFIAPPMFLLVVWILSRLMLVFFYVLKKIDS